MKIITVLNQKGGVGKTTVSLGLFSALQHENKRVLLVDLDEQSNATHGVINDYTTPTIYELYKGVAEVQDAIIHTSQGDIIPGSLNMNTIDAEIKRIDKQFILKEILEPLKKKYDFIIIDTQADIGTTTINALVSADYVIIPTHAQAFSIDGIITIKSAIDQVKKYFNKKLKCLGIVLNQYNARTKLSKELLPIIEEQAQTLNTTVFETKIRQCGAIGEAQLLMESIIDYAPRSNGAKDFKALAKEVIERI